MKILVACEESQAVTKEFRRLGHEAYSGDTEPCSGGHPEWHFQYDVVELLKDSWDMIIAFPPCTFLSNAGACRLYPTKGNIDPVRYQKGLKAKDFFMLFYNHPCEKVVIENPVSSKVFKMPQHTQEIQPYEHGHPWSKKTRLWVRGVKPLEPSNIVENTGPFVPSGTGRKDKTKYGAAKRAGGDSKNRSKTFIGIAKAMAEQWGGNITKRQKQKPYLGRVKYKHKRKNMKVLIACEESQAVAKEFRRLGHEAYSCDIEQCSGGHPEWHLKNDAASALFFQKWDIVIAFPPCTDLCVSGARWFKEKIADGRQQKAIDFFMMFAGYPCRKKAIESPIGIMSTKYRKPDQIIQPWQHGHGETKSTCLWLFGLPKLEPTNIVKGREQKIWKMAPSENRAKLRSKTYSGIAKAMAEQWGGKNHETANK